MAVNSLSPAFVQINYGASAGGRDHTMVFGVKPVVTPLSSTSTDLLTQDGSAIEFPDAMGQFCGLLAAVLSTTYQINFVKLFNATDPEVPYLVAALYIGTSGTVATVPPPFPTRATISYAAEDGGGGKLVILGSLLSPNVVLRAPTYGGQTAYRNIADYILSNAEGVIYSRSNAFPVFVHSIISKTDDHWRGQILAI
jgi:hypothetical protein